jgi:hypothetical protein
LQNQTCFCAMLYQIDARLGSDVALADWRSAVEVRVVEDLLSVLALGGWVRLQLTSTSCSSRLSTRTAAPSQNRPSVSKDTFPRTQRDASVLCSNTTPSRIHLPAPSPDPWSSLPPHTPPASLAPRLSAPHRRSPHRQQTNTMASRKKVLLKVEQLAGRLSGACG